MNEWSELKQRVLNGALKHLDSLGVSYKVITPAGEYGTLQVVPPKPVKPAKEGKRIASIFPRGELNAYFTPFLAGLPVGGEVCIPVDKYGVKAIQASVSSWSVDAWGKGSVVTMRDHDKQTVTVLRIM
jgi:hypothetical protein